MQLSWLHFNLMLKFMVKGKILGLLIGLGMILFTGTVWLIQNDKEQLRILRSKQENTK